MSSKESKDAPGRKEFSSEEAPSVTFEEIVAGRDTMSAIAFDHPTRFRLETKNYGDRISNAPGAMSPKIHRALEQPDVVVTVAPVGRRTQALIESELDDSPQIEIDGVPTNLPEIDALVIERLHMFLVAAPPQALDNPRSREVLLRSRLLPALAGVELTDVTRYEITPTNETGQLLARVWTKVS